MMFINGNLSVKHKVIENIEFQMFKARKTEDVFESWGLRVINT